MAIRGVLGKALAAQGFIRQVKIGLAAEIIFDVF
jgi:hypothetical protein